MTKTNHPQLLTRKPVMKKIFTTIIFLMMATLSTPTVTSINPNFFISNVAQPITSIGGANFTENENGLVAGWHLNGDLTDFSGNGNAGAGTGITYGNGKFGQGAVFNGINSNIIFSSTVINQAEKTITFWVNFSSMPSTSQIFNLVEVGKAGSNGFYFDMCGVCSPQVLRFASTDGNGSSANSNLSNFSTGVWYMITGTSNSSGNAILYVNGQQVGTGGPGTYTSATYNLSFGYAPSLSSRFFPGGLDEVRIYNRILSAAEIKNLYLYNAIAAPNNAIFWGTVF